jgi:diguanylate cyclase (GGDEF)-like protein
VRKIKKDNLIQNLQEHVLSLETQLRQAQEMLVVTEAKNSAILTEIDKSKRLNDILKKLAFKDHLTGFKNRRAFIAELRKEIKRTKRTKRSFCIIMLDIDNFKSINENHGHVNADKALRETAKVIRRSLRESDSVGRYGGEEFLVLLPETNLIGGFEVAEKIRKALEKHSIGAISGKSLTVSGGVGEYGLRDNNLENILIAVDTALAISKKSGKNRITKVHHVH